MLISSHSPTDSVWSLVTHLPDPQSLGLQVLCLIFLTCFFDTKERKKIMVKTVEGFFFKHLATICQKANDIKQMQCLSKSAKQRYSQWTFSIFWNFSTQNQTNRGHYPFNNVLAIRKKNMLCSQLFISIFILDNLTLQINIHQITWAKQCFYILHSQLKQNFPFMGIFSN